MDRSVLECALPVCEELSSTILHESPTTLIARDDCPAPKPFHVDGIKCDQLMFVRESQN